MGFHLSRINTKCLETITTASGNEIDRDSDPELNMPLAQLSRELERANESDDEIVYESDSEIRDEEIINREDEIVLRDIETLIALVNKLCQSTSNAGSSGSLSIEEIVEWNDDYVQEGDFSDSEEERESSDTEIERAITRDKISHQDGYDALKLAYEYAQQENLDEHVLLAFRVARDNAMKARISKKKQITITNFFN